MKTGVVAERAAKVIATAATASRPRTRYTVGRDAAILVRLARVVSDRFLDRILRLGLRPALRQEFSTKRAALRPVDFNRCS
jgi:hypothetical protein